MKSNKTTYFRHWWRIEREKKSNNIYWKVKQWTWFFFFFFFLEQYLVWLRVIHRKRVVFSLVGFEEDRTRFPIGSNLHQSNSCEIKSHPFIYYGLSVIRRKTPAESLRHYLVFDMSFCTKEGINWIEGNKNDWLIFCLGNGKDKVMFLTKDDLSSPSTIKHKEDEAFDPWEQHGMSSFIIFSLPIV